eukprot:COSAG02_NODE_27110_length_616_cov_2.357834_1_plen_65_part_10
MKNTMLSMCSHNSRCARRLLGARPLPRSLSPHALVHVWDFPILGLWGLPVLLVVFKSLDHITREL